MKQNFNVPVVFKVKAASEVQAKQYVDRFMQYGFESLCEYEQITCKAIKHWCWAQIRGVK